MGSSSFVYSFKTTECISHGFCRFTKLRIWYKSSQLKKGEYSSIISGYRFENPIVLVCPATGERLQNKSGREYGRCWSPYEGRYNQLIPFDTNIDKCINCDYRESYITTNAMLTESIGTKRLQHIVEYHQIIINNY